MKKYIKNNLSLPLQTFLIGSFLTLASLRKFSAPEFFWSGFYRGAPNKTRSFSTDRGNSNKFKPAVVYANADTQKMQIIQENKGRSGVYR